MKTLTVQNWRQLSHADRPLAKLKKGKIRVKVKYAGVGRTDITALRGGYLMAPRRPFSPGYEFFGVDEDGRRVAGILPWMGTYCEYLDLDPRWCVAVPDAVSDETAAAIPLNYLTALWLLEKSGRFQSGDKTLVHGAGGGAGLAILELAREIGIKAWGLASQGRAAEIAALGATLIDRQGDWVAEAKRLVPEGFRAVFDAQGIDSFRNSWNVLGRGGRLAAYGFARSLDGGTRDYFAGTTFLVLKSFNLSGKSFSICALPVYADIHPRWYRESLTRLFDLATHGKIAPCVQDVFPWYEAEKAHAVIEEGRVRGKLLLDFGV